MSNRQNQLTELRRKLEIPESLRDLLGKEAVEKARAELETCIQDLTETDGGAFVAGDVDTRGGDFVKRDKWQIFLGDQYVSVSPDQVEPEVLLQAYLRTLAADCRCLPLGVVDPRFLQTDAETPVPLSDIYVDWRVRCGTPWM